MAYKKVMIGSYGPFIYDDSKVIADPSFGGATQQGIITTGYVQSVGGTYPGGDSGSVTLITAIQDNEGTIEYKTRTLTISAGCITTIGNESDWIST